MPPSQLVLLENSFGSREAQALGPSPRTGTVPQMKRRFEVWLDNVGYVLAAVDLDIQRAELGFQPLDQILGSGMLSLGSGHRIILARS